MLQYIELTVIIITYTINDKLKCVYFKLKKKNNNNHIGVLLIFDAYYFSVFIL